jgi:PAS domain S-box-containing protein
MKIRILMLEDVELDSELTEYELKSAKIDFISKRVEEESDFIRELKEFKPDLILADNSLPHFNGESALKIVKKRYPEIPFIFVSGKMGEDFAVEMLKQGATDYVLKSNLKKIGHAVHRALNESNEQLERKIAESALIDSENKYRTLFEKNKNPIIVFDDRGNFLESNEAALKFMETKREKLLTMNLNEFILPNDSLLGTDLWVKDEIDKISELNFDIHGKNKIMELTITPVNSKGKNILFGVGKDITERKIDEVHLKRTMKELERSNRELKQFAHVSSHDLQEPLRMVSLFSQLLEKRYKDKLDSDANEFIEYIVDGAQRMRQLIDDLQTYSRIKDNSSKFKNVNLELILNDVITDSYTLIVENDVMLTHNNLPTVYGDPFQITQVLQNLITNAIKFQRDNTPDIHISAEKGKNEWMISVCDNGIGIELRHQKQIFELFKRLHTREKYPGTGIGLSICQKIVRYHGGLIGVKSEIGKGSIFYFTLPDTG